LVLDSSALDRLFVTPRPVVANPTARRTKKVELHVAGLIDRQRSTNIEIGLRRVNLPIEQVVGAIMKCNSDPSQGGLTEEMLAALVETLPTQDEITSLRAYAVNIMHAYTMTCHCIALCRFRAF
jgi:hypothetical protein